MLFLFKNYFKLIHCVILQVKNLRIMRGRLKYPYADKNAVYVDIYPPFVNKIKRKESSETVINAIRSGIL
jgi:hypothetical protein